MAKLTKAQAKAHAEACKILEQDRLAEDDRLFVLENWQESAQHINSIAGAFFTPTGLARDFSIEVGSGRIIDLCAGIGSLSFFVRGASSIACVEANPDYVSVGRKIVPDAEWIVGDVFDLPPALYGFDWAISNPPFGALKRARSAPRYRGKSFELHVIDIASDIARLGTFIVPQMTAPFKYSGCAAGYSDCPNDQYERFVELTGIELEPNCGIDTEAYRGDWHGVSVTTEIVKADFEEAQARRQPAQAVLFAEAAE